MRKNIGNINDDIPTGYKKTALGIIPEDWQVVKLGDVCEINPKSCVMPTIFQYIELEGVENGILKESKLLFAEDAPSRAQRVVAKGDILYQTVRPYQQNNLFFDFEGDYVASTGYAQIRANCNALYIYYWLHTRNFVNEVILRCTGTSYPAINANDLSGISILLPPIDKQQKIAEVLSFWDDSINKLEELIKHKQLFKKGMMQQIFSQKLRFKADDGIDYPDWEEKMLGELISCLDHKRKPINSEQRANITGTIPYYGANGIVDYITEFIFNEELVLLAEDGGNFDDYKNKPIAQYITGKAWVNNHAHVIKGKDSVSTKFIFYSLVHKDIRAWINGTSRSKLNKADMLCIIVNIPLFVKEQQKIADCLTCIDDEILLLNQQLEQLKLQKKSLMQKLLTGKIMAC